MEWAAPHVKVALPLRGSCVKERNDMAEAMRS